MATSLVKPLFFYFLESIYLHAASAAIAPSEEAVVTCLIAFVRQSPATNTPSVSVRHASSAIIYPCSLSLVRFAKQSFSGTCPMATKTPGTLRTVSSPVFVLRSYIPSRELSPTSSDTTVSYIISTLLLFSSISKSLASPVMKERF